MTEPTNYTFEPADMTVGTFQLFVALCEYLGLDDQRFDQIMFKATRLVEHRNPAHLEKVKQFYGVVNPRLADKL